MVSTYSNSLAFGCFACRFPVIFADCESAVVLAFGSTVGSVDAGRRAALFLVVMALEHVKDSRYCF